MRVLNPNAQVVAVLGNCGTEGRSVRAAVANQDARVGNSGGQRRAEDCPPYLRIFCASESLCYYPGFSSKSRPDTFGWMKDVWIQIDRPKDRLPPSLNRS